MTLFSLAGTGLLGGVILTFVAMFIGPVLGYTQVSDIIINIATVMMLSGVSCMVLFTIVNW